MFLINVLEKIFLLNLAFAISVAGLRWEPLNVGLVKRPNMETLPDKMMVGFRKIRLRNGNT